MIDPANVFRAAPPSAYQLAGVALALAIAAFLLARRPPRPPAVPATA